MSLFVEIKAADGMVSRTRLEPGRNRISVRLGDSYRIYDEATGATPPGVSVKRLDNMLVVDGLPRAPGDAEAPTVELAEFYTVCSAGSPCQLVLDQTAGAAGTVVTPGSPPIGALADGSFVIHDPGYVPVQSAGVSSFEGSNIGRYALYGLGGLAVVGLAAGGGGGGGDGGGGGSIADSALKFTGASTFNDRLPTLRGEGQAGSRIVIRIDSDGDGQANAVYATTVGPDNRWSLDLKSATPESGSLPAGLGDNNNIGVTQTSEAGTSTLAPFAYRFDGTPPSAAVISPVTGDNVINAGEKAAGVTVSGTAEPGATVTVSWGGAQQAGTVDPAGNWTVTFPPGSVPADGNVPVSAIVTDPAGNSSATAQLALMIDTRPGAPVIAAVAGDNVVNAAEKAAGVTVTGTAAAGSSVTVSWGASSQTTPVDVNGQWSVQFPAEAVPADSPSPVAVIAIATDVFGTPSPQASLPVTINTAPATLAVAAVAVDNIVNAVEAGTDVSISGTSDPGAMISVAWLGLPAREVTADGSGAWSVSYAAGAIPAGNGVAQPYQVSATNSIGNSGSASGVVTIDTVAPAAPIISTAPIATNDIVNALEKANGVTITGTVTEPGLVVSVTWGGLPAVLSAPADGGGNWSVVFPASSIPGDGLHNLVATTVDAAGNASPASAPREVTISTTPPAAATAIVASGDNVVDFPETYGVTGTAPAGSVVTVSIDGSPSVATVLTGTTWTTEPGAFSNINPLGGSGTITVTVTDAAGNATLATQGITYAPPLGFDPADPPALVLSAEMLFAGASLEGSDASFPLAGSAGTPWLDNPNGIASLIPFEDRSA